MVRRPAVTTLKAIFPGTVSVRNNSANVWLSVPQWICIESTRGPFVDRE